MRELRFMISKNSQQESAMPTGQQTKKVSTSDIKPAPYFGGDGATYDPRRWGCCAF
jgi:hypothetical protein